MPKVAIVTDSSAHIPAELLQGLPAYVLPLHLVWGDQTYRDNVDMLPQEFYDRLKVAKTMPHTSQSTPLDFLQIYQPLVEQGYDILSIHVSTRLTSNMNNAVRAKESLPGAHIELFDSQTSAMAQGFQVLSAARAAVKGASLQTCKEIAERVRSRSSSLFALGTLEFLRRGGRIGGATAFLGSLLQFKPILETRNGVVEAIERVRTLRKAKDRIIEILKGRVGASSAVRLAAMHSNVPELATELLEQAVERIGKARVLETVLCGISPVLGTHLGPGGIGISYVVEG